MHFVILLDTLSYIALVFILVVCDIHTGCELSKYKEPFGSDMPDSGGHDKGENTGGDSQDI